MYRGTILELLVDDHVDLRLASGEVKRFRMSDIAYAGPATEPAAAPAPPPSLPPPAPPAAPQPPAPRPLVTLEAPPARLHFEATTPDVDFHIRTDEATVSGMVWTTRGFGTYAGVAHGYDHICTAPCDATLPAGTHRLALSQGDRSPVEPDQATTITGPATVRGTYVDRRGTRIGGWVLFGASLATMTGLMVASFQTTQNSTDQSFTGSCYPTTSINGGLLGAGVAVGIGGSLLSLVFILQHDTATIDVVPLGGAAFALPAHRAEAALLPAATTGAQGLGVRARF